MGSETRQQSPQDPSLQEHIVIHPGPTPTSKMAEGPDMEQRDINELNSHVKAVFEEVLGEPDGVRSIDCVWRNSYKCFNWALRTCYIILTVICGIPLAFCWGCEFACVACYHIWWITPSIRCIAVNCGAFKNILTICLNSCLTPIMSSCSECFASFRK